MIDKEAFEREYEEKYRLAQEAANGNFLKFLRNLGKDPKTDLAGYNLPNYDFSNEDLAGANLRKMNLSSAKFRGTILIGADLSYSDISGADFTDADLTGTNFYHVRAENAIFCNNLGLYERIKLNLSEQRAIFQEKPNLMPELKEPSQENIAKDLQDDPNIKAYIQLINDPAKFNQHRDKFVAFIGGELVASEKTEQAIKFYLSKNYQDINKSPLIIQITGQSQNRIREFPLLKRRKF